jgi:hypothetical protein
MQYGATIVDGWRCYSVDDRIEIVVEWLVRDSSYQPRWTANVEMREALLDSWCVVLLLSG